MNEKEVAENIATIKAQIKTLFENQKSQSELTKVIHDLTIEVRVMNQSQVEIKEDLGQLQDTVSHMQQIPSKRWEQVVAGIIGTAVAALAGYILIRLGIK